MQHVLRLVPTHPEAHFVNLDALTYAGNLLNLRAAEDAPNYAFDHADWLAATADRSYLDYYDTQYGSR